jgi:uncharacterized protein with HEPN domain
VRDDLARLRDIIRAIDKIQKETQVHRSVFAEDPKLQVWVLYHLQIIGEGCLGLSAAFRAENPDPVWSKAVGLRNILVHHYFEIDEDLIWQVLINDLPPFRNTAVAALNRLEANRNT